MPRRTQFSQRRGERGQTIVLVAISIVSLLAMAALAIDVVTLYVARSEIQRAADAAALAGAKGIADSGITSLSSVDLAVNLPQIQNLAQNMAAAAINAVLANNTVAGSAPSLVAGSPSFPTFTSATVTPVNSWQVTVALQQTNLPTFFARIFGRTGATVTASATAEAYNPANLPSFTPIAPKGVKPWLVANKDPAQCSHPQFVNPVTGDANPGVLNDPDFWLTADCNAGGGNCALSANPPGALACPQRVVQYVPALVTPNSGNVCNSSCLGSDYENSIQCYDANTYSCGGGSPNAHWDTTGSVNPNGSAAADTTDGVECLIHAVGTGLGQGQDSFSIGTWPSGPMEMTAGSGPLSGKPVATSNSVVTIPIIDVDTPGAFSAAGPVTVIGFLQAFVEQIDVNNNIQVKVLNVAGCSQTSNGAPPIIGGNGTSPIPVRLITP